MNGYLRLNIARNILPRDLPPSIWPGSRCAYRAGGTAGGGPYGLIAEVAASYRDRLPPSNPTDSLRRQCAYTFAKAVLELIKQGLRKVSFYDSCHEETDHNGPYYFF